MSRIPALTSLWGVREFKNEKESPVFRQKLRWVRTNAGGRLPAPLSIGEKLFESLMIGASLSRWEIVANTDKPKQMKCLSERLWPISDSSRQFRRLAELCLDADFA
jgi:hypothetical protein